MQKTKRNPSPLAKYESARANLILMIALTLLNVIMAVAGSNSVMLFSATVPHLLASIGIVEEFSAFLVPGIILALLNIGLYFLCWIFSKKHYGWMIAALVLFSIDTLIMAGIYLLVGDFSGIIDVAVHIWVLYYLVVGTINGPKLKNLTEEDIKDNLGNGEEESKQEPEEEPKVILNGEEMNDSIQ